MGAKERERESPPVCLPPGTLQLQRTPPLLLPLLSVSPSLLSVSPSVLELALPPCLVQSGLGKAGPPRPPLPPHVTGSHLDGGRRRQRFRETDRVTENERKEKAILIASRGDSITPSLNGSQSWETRVGVAMRRHIWPGM